MMKILLATLMFSVSTLAYADKWEYGELDDFTYQGANIIETSYSFVPPDGNKHHSGVKGTSGMKLDVFAESMGLAKQNQILASVVNYLNLLGADGWELVSVLEVKDDVTRTVRYIFKRKID